MIFKKQLQHQYEGFIATKFLWRNSVFNKIQIFENQNIKHVSFKQGVKGKIRLGKLVEQFVFHELRQDNSIKILAENIQIQDGKITVGELDCLLLKNETPIHLEIVYKFYLYDASVGATEIAHWIGPNRCDSWIQKLQKLHEKQLPLLYHPKTKPLLDSLDLKTVDIIQRVYFKAQLFVPLHDFDKEFSIVNNDCITGFYIDKKELKQFSNCKFYIPTKKDWLCETNPYKNWVNLDKFKVLLEEYLSQKNAPLCWLKKPNGELCKFFVVWWGC